MEHDAIVKVAETAEEREAIYRQRYSIYAEELHVYESLADHERKILTDDNDAASRLVYARIGNDVVGTIRVQLVSDASLPDLYRATFHVDEFVGTVPYERMGVISRFMVNKPYRHTNVAFALMRAVLEVVLRDGVQLLFLDCSPHLVNLYLSLGFRTYTSNYHSVDLGVVVPMVGVLPDLDHLARIRSPLLPLMQQYVTRADVPSWTKSILPTDSGMRSEQADVERYWSQAYALLTEKSQGGFSVLDGLSEEQIKLLLARGHVIDCAQGELVIRKGMISHGIFMVLSGVVEVRNEARVLAVLGQGEVFGEMGFLLASPRSADVYALSERVRILSLDEQILQKLIQSDAATSAKFLLNLSKILCLRLANVQS
jgi:predicted GNAT family N-acyltransferase